MTVSSSKKQILSRLIVALSVSVLACYTVIGQNFIFPMDLRPVYLSANFGELRPNHFHSGLDMKTEKVEGKVVRAIDTGFVSRIQISPYGYGHVLYIDHPSGYTSVYAHLKSFNAQIDSLVKAYQYEKKVNQFDISIESDKLPVSQGQQIALSGNTGSSGGPHLHFEIRKTENQHALNPMIFYDLRDNVRPKIMRIGVYPMDSLSFVNHKQTKQFFEVVSKGNGVYVLKEPVTVWGTVGFSVQGYDYMPEMTNIYGFYTTTLTCNGNTLYSRRLDEVDFATTKDINSLIDYEERLTSKRYFERMFVDKNNDLKIYTKLTENGLYKTTNDTVGQCKVRVTDFKGNAAEVTIQLTQQFIDSLDVVVPNPKKQNTRVFNSSDTFAYTYEDFSFRAKERSFFTDFTMDVTVDKSNPKNRYYSNQYKIETDQVIFRKSAEIAIPFSVPEELKGKAIIENCRKKTPIMTRFPDDGRAHAYIKTGGTFAVVVDTIPPKITLKMEDGADMSKAQYILFKMSDNYSGVAKYNAYIDGEWSILDFDGKSGAVFLWFDENKMEFNRQHTLKIVLEDLCHNVFIKEVSFFK